jgi:hypothetical protein
MNHRKVYRKRLLEKVEEKEARHKTMVDKPIEISCVDGVMILLTDDEKMKIQREITERMEGEHDVHTKWKNGHSYVECIKCGRVWED